jgi:hypothetical protein
VDEDVAIALFGKVPLDCLVGAVGIAHQNRKTFLDHGVDPALHVSIETRQLS